MSTIDFRPRLSADLRNDIERAAKMRGISASEWIEAAVRKELKTNIGRAERAVGLKADRTLDRIDNFFGELDRFIGQFNHLLNTTAQAIPRQLKKEFDGLKTTITNTGGTAHLRDLLKQLIADFETRQNARFSKLESAVDQGAEHRVTRAAIGQLQRGKLRDRWMVGAGALGCFLTLAALAFLFADTAPSRWVATRLVGESSALPAGIKLSSEYEVVRRPLLQTRILLGSSEEFARNFSACVDRLARASEPASCRLTYDPAAISAANSAQ